MPYCGRYGCGCCTCQDCGTYGGCVCDLKKRTEEYLKRSAEWGDDGEHRELLREWLDKQ